MSRVFPELSIGRVADRLARGIGWSPVGRWLTLIDAEGPEASWLEDRSVRVVTLEGDDMIVESPAVSGNSHGEDTHLRLTPRHTGWTAHSLMLVGIAVIVRRPRSRDSADSIGIVMATLDRTRVKDR